MNLKEIKQRILSVKGTQKITSAMKLVSAAKLRRAQARIEGMRPYQLKLDAMLSSFLSSLESVESPYIAERGKEGSRYPDSFRFVPLRQFQQQYNTSCQ